MKSVAGWWLPGHESHLEAWFSHPKNKNDIIDGRVMYQGAKQRAALALCKNFRTAVDIGGHCGTHSWVMAKHFQAVHAFEPVEEHRACFVRNVTEPNVILYPVALGAAPGRVAMFTQEGSSGNSHVSGDGDIEMWTLDSYELADVDYLKADVEGAELYVLQGAIETIARCRPVINVEQKPHVITNFGFKRPEAVNFLLDNDYVVAKELSGDFMMVPKG